ncbi:MAG TPA: NADH-quinone oxidoreductase subunit A [Verrucomicrobiota bacterium]|nr:NADH-quinone oxidoreductase subunit A [Verrucomicrobiota bacterium]
MDSQLNQYLAVLILLAAAVLFTAGMLVSSAILGQAGRRSKTKDLAYECGMIPVGAGTPRTSIRFHIVAVLFLLFDVAVVFLYPWAVVYRKMVANPETAAFAVFGMIGFLVVLSAAYVYAVKQGAFEWHR